MCIRDRSKPHLYPNFDTPALLTCSAQAGDVCMTMVDGNILYENGEFKTLDAVSYTHLGRQGGP